MTIREQLMNRPKKGPTVVAVPTPEWSAIQVGDQTIDLDGQVFVPTCSAAAMDRWYEAPGGNSRALWVALFACDSVGNRHFNDEDASWLGNEDFAVIDRIFQTGMALNRNTPAARAETEKN